MAFKKLDLEVYNCCPNCKGKTGVTFHQKANVKYNAEWGTSSDNFKNEKVVIPDGVSQTVVCSDCKQRFTLI